MSKAPELPRESRRARRPTITSNSAPSGTCSRRAMRGSGTGKMEPNSVDVAVRASQQLGLEQGQAREPGRDRFRFRDLFEADDVHRLDRQLANGREEVPTCLHRGTPPPSKGHRDRTAFDSSQSFLLQQHA